jgi:hypothetical protein
VTPHWYLLIVASVALLWLGSTPHDRIALRIVMLATLTSWLLVDFGTSRLTGAWKLSVPGAVETVTILALLHWGGRSGCYQAGCLVIAWLAHVLCFVDVTAGTDMVYSRYEAILAGVSIAQIALFHETYLHHFRRLGHWWSSSGGDSPVVVHTPSLSSPVLHHPRHQGAQTTTP